MEELRAVIEALPAGLRGVRDRAVLLLAFAGALRRSEVVGLDVDDIEEVPEVLRVMIRRSKTDQEAGGAGRRGPQRDEARYLPGSGGARVA